MPQRSTGALALFALAAASAHAQFVSDGNLDALPVGNAPDCGTPAGAWQFPANYIPAFNCEAVADQVRIVPTGTFQPGAPGNSLVIQVNAPAINIHAINLFNTPIHEEPCLVASVSFQIWVPEEAQAGGSVYIGADHGGGGFNSASDRGPQISWRGDGTIAYATPDPTDPFLSINTPIVSGYPRAMWQQVELHIRLDDDRFDLYWAPLGQPLQLVGPDLPFRSPGDLHTLDRFTLAHFGATYPSVRSAIDNLDVVVSLPACYPNCDGSTAQPSLNIADFTCFLQRFAAQDPYANCDGSTVQPTLNVADFSCFLQAFAAGCC